MRLPPNRPCRARQTVSTARRTAGNSASVSGVAEPSAADVADVAPPPPTPLVACALLVYTRERCARVCVRIVILLGVVVIAHAVGWRWERGVSSWRLSPVWRLAADAKSPVANRRSSRAQSPRSPYYTSISTRRKRACNGGGTIDSSFSTSTPSSANGSRTVYTIHYRRWRPGRRHRYHNTYTYIIYIYIRKRDLRAAAATVFVQTYIIVRASLIPVCSSASKTMPLVANARVEVGDADARRRRRLPVEFSRVLRFSFSFYFLSTVSPSRRMWCVGAAGYRRVCVSVYYLIYTTVHLSAVRA